MESRIAKFISQSQGALLVLLSQVLSSIVNVGVKILVTQFQTPVNPFQILNARVIVTLGLSAGYCWHKNVPDHPFGPKEVRKLMLFRAAGGCCGAMGFYYSLEYLPLGEATVLNLLAPLGSCCFIALLTLGSFPRTHIIAAVVSLCSVVLIAKPSFLFGHQATGCIGPSNASVSLAACDAERLRAGRLLTGVMFAILGACGGAVSTLPVPLLMPIIATYQYIKDTNDCWHLKCAYSSIRLIGNRAHPLISVNYFASAVLLFTSLAMFIPEFRPNFGLSLMQIILLFSIGILSFSTVSKSRSRLTQREADRIIIQEFIMTKGLSFENSSAATQMIFSQILFATIMDWLIWRVVPNIASTIGGVLLVSSISAVLLHRPEESSKERVEQEIPLQTRFKATTDEEDIDLESLLPEDPLLDS